MPPPAGSEGGEVAGTSQRRQGATLDAMPWVTAKGMPSNAATGNRYNGVNIVSLWIARESKDYSTDIWATYKQWQDLGAPLSSSTPIWWRFWKSSMMNKKSEKKCSFLSFFC